MYKHQHQTGRQAGRQAAYDALARTRGNLINARRFTCCSTPPTPNYVRTSLTAPAELDAYSHEGSNFSLRNAFGKMSAGPL